jgi:hypothetical protein
VISIQSIMLVALGFLTATLLALLIAPAFWSRAVRLTTRKIKENLPLTEAEIRADKDRLRAEYAIRVHKLEMKVEQANLQRARQTIEINRRDGNISLLEQEVAKYRLLVDENQNARRVLEQTVADRLPRVEHRLTEAKTLLFNRDREISELTQSARRQQMALEEAGSINSQQTAEIDRLSNALTIRGARNQQALADPSFEGELALRSEIEALRGKTREQAQLINRLQSQVGRGLGVIEQHDLRRGQIASEATGRPASDSDVAAYVPLEGRADLERELRNLRAKFEDQAAENAKLNAELQTLQSTGEVDATGLKESKIALKARLNASQAQSEQQTETIKRLRAELAATNERLALQGAHFMDQMRRLGAGTLPASGQSRKPVTQGSRATLSERVAQSRSSPPPHASRPKVVSNGSGISTVEPAPIASLATPSTKADVGSSSVPEAAIDKPMNGKVEAKLPNAAVDGDVAAPQEEIRKPRLIDRISSINKG